MNQLQVDPATGFLESVSPSFATFDAVKKSKFIELAQRCVDEGKSPRLSSVCKAVGVSMASFWNHVHNDEEFKRQWDEIRFQVEDMLENSLVNLGQKANGVGAAAFWLKNKVPERWSDNPQINQNFQDFEWLKKLTSAFISINKPPIIATDAVITSTPSKQVDKSTNDSDVKRE